MSASNRSLSKPLLFTGVSGGQRGERCLAHGGETRIVGTVQAMGVWPATEKTK